MKRQSNAILGNAKMLLAFLVVYMGSILNVSAGSFTPGTQNGHLSTLTQEADLIFKGTLNDISYGLSIENIPYTFVTYSVDDVIAGEYQNGNITLKFVGGPFPNGNTLRASNSPNVTLGEESILFVQQRLDTGCDFVQCEHGRIQVNNGSLIAANDSALVIDENSDIKYIPVGVAGQKADNHNKASLSQFKSYIAKLSKGQAGQKKNFLSNDKNLPFKAYSGLTQAAKAPEILEKTKGESGPKDMSPHDLWEINQLKENNGNPIFK